MKLAFFDNYKLGVVVGDKIVDVSGLDQRHQGARPPGPDPRPDREVGHYKAKVGRPPPKRQGRAAVEGRLRPPVPRRATSSAWR